VRRQDLDELTDNPRLIRYFEGLQKALSDVTTLQGDIDPNGFVKANASRMYINTDTNKLWINTSADYGQLTGWVLAN
jgi:hypothetical protein